MKSVILSWSGGKDSALALYYLNKKKFNIKTLFTTISIEYNRVSMHGIRKEVLLKQVKSIGLPLHIISLPKNVTDEEYGEIMKEEMVSFKSNLIDYVVAGEGEEYILHIAQLIEGGDKNKTVFHKKRLDLESLPLADYSLDSNIERFISSY
ncbi:MAG: hypothetical protein ACFFAO_14870, partial [Candidatus Hermodarchaeota archaeon]